MPLCTELGRMGACENGLPCHGTCRHWRHPHGLPDYVQALLSLQKYGDGNSTSSTFAILLGAFPILLGERPEGSQGRPEARKALKVMLAQCNDTFLSVLAQVQENARSMLARFRHPNRGKILGVCGAHVPRHPGRSTGCHPHLPGR